MGRCPTQQSQRRFAMCGNESTESCLAFANDIAQPVPTPLGGLTKSDQDPDRVSL